MLFSTLLITAWPGVVSSVRLIWRRVTPSACPVQARARRRMWPWPWGYLPHPTRESNVCMCLCWKSDPHSNFRSNQRPESTCLVPCWLTSHPLYFLLNGCCQALFITKKSWTVSLRRSQRSYGHGSDHASAAVAESKLGQGDGSVLGVCLPLAVLGSVLEWGVGEGVVFFFFFLKKKSTRYRGKQAFISLRKCFRISHLAF